MLGWIIVAGLVVLGIYGISKTSVVKQPGIFKIADKFLTGTKYITFYISHPGTRTAPYIIGFGGATAGVTLHAIEIKCGETKDFGKSLGTFIKVDVAVNQSNMRSNYKPRTFEYSGWISMDYWSKIKPYLEPIKNLQYLFVD